MLLLLLYLAVRRLLRLLTMGGDRDQVARGVELLVLRHQLRVLSRGRRLQLQRRDRILLAAASRLLPRERWRCFPVSPQTVLRWHRELLRRKWTYPQRRRRGRPRVATEVTTLVLRLAKENPRRVRVEDLRTSLLCFHIRSPRIHERVSSSPYKGMDDGSRRHIRLLSVDLRP